MDSAPASPFPDRRRASAGRAWIGAVASAIALITFASPAPAANPAKKKHPVKLTGTVANKGTTTAKNGAVTLHADNFSFAKTFVKTTPGTVSVTVENRSKSAHTFTIDDLDIDEDLAAGKSITVDVEVDTKPVAFYCKFHKGSGMQGALFTKAGANASTGSTSQGSSGAGSAGNGYY